VIMLILIITDTISDDVEPSIIWYATAFEFLIDVGVISTAILYWRVFG